MPKPVAHILNPAGFSSITCFPFTGRDPWDPWGSCLPHWTPGRLQSLIFKRKNVFLQCFITWIVNLFPLPRSFPSKPWICEVISAPPERARADKPRYLNQFLNRTSRNVSVEVLGNSWCVCYVAITVGITVDGTGASSERGTRWAAAAAATRFLLLKANTQLHNPEFLIYNLPELQNISKWGEYFNLRGFGVKSKVAKLNSELWRAGFLLQLWPGSSSSPVFYLTPHLEQPCSSWAQTLIISRNTSAVISLRWVFPSHSIPSNIFHLFPKIKLENSKFSCSIPARAPEWISSFPLETQAYVACSISLLQLL